MTTDDVPFIGGHGGNVRQVYQGEQNESSCTEMCLYKMIDKLALSARRFLSEYM